jgi:hypothetical protein
MNREQSRTTVILLWSVPLGLVAAMIGANVALAGVLARLLHTGGLTPGNGIAGLGFWAVFFGGLAAGNFPALAAFAGWVRAEEREREMRAEVLSAVRWPARLDRWQPQLWPGVPAPGMARSCAVSEGAGRARLGCHLMHALRFLCALTAPVALIGLLQYFA